jgi:integrase
VPPADLLPWRQHRASPYLYSDEDIAALIEAATTLRWPFRVATYQTLIGLLSVTGMRVGEAINLDVGSLEAASGVLLIRHAKFDKTREVPLHPTTTLALRRCLACRESHQPPARSPALFISPPGTRLLYCNVQWTFQCLVREAGLGPRAGSCRPRIHDLTLLSTYLGHVDPAATYWYLSAAPELLALAAERLDQRQGEQR